MSLWTIHESAEFAHCWNRWVNLASFLVKIDHVKHDLSSFITIRHLGNQGKLFRFDASILTICWDVCAWILSAAIATIKHTLNCTDLGCLESVQLLVFKIVGNPTSVDQDSLLFSISIQMGVERCNNINTSLAVAHFSNLNFSVMIEHSFDANRLHWPIFLKLIDFVTTFTPNKMTLICRGDIYWSLWQIRWTTISFIFLLLSFSVLIFSGLVKEYCRESKEVSVNYLIGTYLELEQWNPWTITS